MSDPVFESIEIKDEDIPRGVFDNFKVLENKPKYKKKTLMQSNFLITYNPNISYRALIDTEARMRVFKKLVALMRNIEVNLKNKKLLKEYQNVPIGNLAQFSYSIEQGLKRGFLHIHAIARFDGYAQIRIDTLRKFCNDAMAPDSKGGMVNIRTYTDSQKMIEAYVSKQQTDENGGEGKFTTLFKSD